MVEVVWQVGMENTGWNKIYSGCRIVGLRSNLRNEGKDDIQEKYLVSGLSNG